MTDDDATRLPLRGGCLCGAVRYEITGAPLYADWCHCSNCRKFGGSSADLYLTVRTAELRLVQGVSSIQTHVPEGAAPRHFCGRCGSPAPDPAPSGALSGISMGTLDDDPGIRPVLRKGLAWRAAWDETDDDLPRFDELPSADELERRGLLPDLGQGG